MLLTYSQIDIYPAGYPSSLERTSIHTNQYDNGLFNPHQFNTYGPEEDYLYFYTDCRM